VCDLETLTKRRPRPGLGR